MASHHQPIHIQYLQGVVDHPLCGRRRRQGEKRNCWKSFFIEEQSGMSIYKTDAGVKVQGNQDSVYQNLTYMTFQEHVYQKKA